MLGGSRGHPNALYLALVEALFSRLASRVRAHLAARIVIAGITLGLLCGVIVAGLLWQQRLGTWRPWAAVLGALGGLVGFAIARRARWSDASVALYLDHKLGSDEAIATALEITAVGITGREVTSREAADDDPLHATVIAQANDAMRGGSKDIWPRVWRLWHAVAPLCAGAIVWLSITQLPPDPAAPPAPLGSEMVNADDVPGLDEVIALAELDGVDEKRAQRLKELAERAKKLKAQLREGMEKREAQSQIAKLRDDIAAERMRFGSGEQRRGLEAALGKLDGLGKLREAQRALGDRDLTAFDAEMERIANQAEAQDRQDAQKALERAEEAAKNAGAPEVAKELAAQRKLLEERSKRAESLRKLAEAFGDALSDEAKRALTEMNRSGDPEAAKQLSEALNKALEGLSDADRQKLADKLKQLAEGLDPDTSNLMPLDKEQLQQMEQMLGSAEGLEQMQKMLKDWANQPPQSAESQRQQRMGEADRQLQQGQRALGMIPMPAPGSPGPPMPGASPAPAGKGPPSQDDTGSPRGPGPGGDEGNDDGFTKPLTGKSLRSRARTRLNPGAPNPSTMAGRGPGRTGETADAKGTGELGRVGPGELRSADQSEVPQEYEEQVGRYFRP